MIYSAGEYPYVKTFWYIARSHENSKIRRWGKNGRTVAVLDEKRFCENFAKRLCNRIDDIVPKFLSIAKTLKKYGFSLRKQNWRGCPKPVRCFVPEAGNTFSMRSVGQTIYRPSKTDLQRRVGGAPRARKKKTKRGALEKKPEPEQNEEDQYHKIAQNIVCSYNELTASGVKNPSLEWVFKQACL